MNRVLSRKTWEEKLEEKNLRKGGQPELAVPQKPFDDD
jgi:hypothetical protein